MQGDTDDELNFIQLLELRRKDSASYFKWLERKADRYTSHDIQNEIIAIMENHVRCGFVSIICDKYIDISNKEQLSICIRWVDRELQAHEIPSGFTMYLT